MTDTTANGKTQHTPGPWKADFEEVKQACSPFDHICYATGDTLEQCEANAALIASAPALLAACKAWDEFSDTLINDMDDSDPLRGLMLRLHGKRIAENKAAILAAEGSQS